MKYLFVAALLMLVSTFAVADQEFNTSDNYCHFILGIDDDGNSVKDGATVDGDNEVFLGNCINSITTIANVAYGSTRVVAKYPSGDTMPMSESLELTGDETGTPCNMTDSNGVQYATNDWYSVYTVRGAEKDQGTGKSKAKGKNAQIEYRLYCNDAP